MVTNAKERCPLLEPIMTRIRELRADRPGITREEARQVLEGEFRVSVEEALNVAFAGPEVVVVNLDEEEGQPGPAAAHARPQPTGCKRRRQPALVY